MTPLPPGLPIVLDASTRRGRRGTLSGGTPRRVLRLSDAGRRALPALERGDAHAPVAVRALARRLVEAGLAHPRPAPRPVDGRVTVVVPVRDRARQLDRCLAAIGAVPVVVVDDGSRDADAIGRVVARHGARLVRRSSPGGPSAARNAALAHLTTELVAFLDSDCVPSSGWLEALAGHLDDPVVAAVAPRIRPRVVAGVAGRYGTARSSLDMGARPGRVLPGARVAYVPTAALLARRDALGAGFDERLTVGEDVDLAWRLADAGHDVRYEPAVTVWHDEPATVPGLLRRRFRYGTSAAPLAVRHRGRLAPAVFPPGPALACLLLLAGRRRLGAAVAALQAARLTQRLRAAAVDAPSATAVRWFGEACAQTALGALRYAATFAALPVAATAVRSRRPLLAGALVVPALDDWRRRRPPLDPLRWTAIALAEDAAYGAGVWWGALRARTLAPLLPATAAGGSRSDAAGPVAR